MAEDSKICQKTGQLGSKNHQWKGGRVIASNGYVLVKVGFGHHLADTRGYAYEHRLVAEEKLGRRLEAGELVHHINENKQDNRPENLQIVPSVADHMALHRSPYSNRRLPGQANLDMVCRCGCGNTISKFDEYGRPRDYITGHNPHQSPALDAVISELRQGQKSVSEIAIAIAKDSRPVRATLSKLFIRGQVIRVAHGVYKLSTDEVA